MKDSGDLDAQAALGAGPSTGIRLDLGQSPAASLDTADRDD
jgi:hypothetical protein